MREPNFTKSKFLKKGARQFSKNLHFCNHQCVSFRVVCFISLDPSDPFRRTVRARRTAGIPGAKDYKTKNHALFDDVIVFLRNCVDFCVHSLESFSDVCAPIFGSSDSIFGSSGPIFGISGRLTISFLEPLTQKWNFPKMERLTAVCPTEMERNAQHCTVTATEFDCGFVYVAAGRSA